MFALIQTNMSLALYLIMLASVIRLRRTRATTPRPYRIPGGKVGLFAVCGVGGLVCLLGVLLSLFPTDDAKGMPIWLYELVLLGGTLGFAVLPFVFYLFRKPSWRTEPVAPEPAGSASASRSRSRSDPEPGDVNGLGHSHPRCHRYGVTPKPARNARSSDWSIRYSSSVPVQFGLMPNDVTVTTTLVRS